MRTTALYGGPFDGHEVDAYPIREFFELTAPVQRLDAATPTTTNPERPGSTTEVYVWTPGTARYEWKGLKSHGQ